MKKLRTYKAHYAKTIYKDTIIEAENYEDSKNIAELKCPSGYHVVCSVETTESFADRELKINK